MNDMQIGKAGEYFVCVDLIMQGYTAFLSEQGLRYDVVADIDGRLFRIQVKTTKTFKAVPQRKAYTPSYLFNVRKCGKGGRDSYKDMDIDIVAFVSLEEKLVGYLPITEVGQTMHFRSRKFKYKTNEAGRYLEDFTFKKCLK